MARRAARAAFPILLVILALLALSPTAIADSAASVHPDAESVRPLAVGETVPSAEVRTIDGEPVDLASLVAESGALLVFYRGGW